MDKDLAAAEAKRLIAMEKRQEDDAYLLSREYDDDYDDQVCDYELSGRAVMYVDWWIGTGHPDTTMIRRFFVGFVSYYRQ